MAVYSRYGGFGYQCSGELFEFRSFGYLRNEGTIILIDIVFLMALCNHLLSSNKIRLDF